MNCKIIYASKTGNTKKVSQSLQKELQTEIFDIQSMTPENFSDFWQKNPADLYFIGTGIYADHVDKQIRDFFISNHPPKGTRFALFATWIGRGNSGPDTLDKFKHFLEKYESKVLNPYFLCYGKMAFFKKEHPDAKDLEAIKAWSHNIMN